MKEMKKHHCEYCDKELEQGETVLCVDNDKFYCKDHYNTFTQYYFEDSELGDENDSQEIEYSNFKCEECGDFEEEDDIYIVNDKALCSFCAMKELGFKLINGSWCKDKLSIEYGWKYLDENGYSYEDGE